MVSTPWRIKFVWSPHHIFKGAFCEGLKAQINDFSTKDWAISHVTQSNSSLSNFSSDLDNCQPYRPIQPRQCYRSLSAPVSPNGPVANQPPSSPAASQPPGSPIVQQVAPDEPVKRTLQRIGKVSHKIRTWYNIRFTFPSESVVIRIIHGSCHSKVSKFNHISWTHHTVP